MIQYKSQAARDAQRIGYGDNNYWLYLDNSAKEKSEYFQSIGDEKQAKKMFTRSLSEALQGNDGE